MARPRKPPTNAPAMPSRIVTMKPPGSRPGVSSLAMTPITSPETIHDRIPMFCTLLSGADASERPRMNRPDEATTSPCAGLEGPGLDAVLDGSLHSAALPHGALARETRRVATGLTRRSWLGGGGRNRCRRRGVLGLR